MARTLPPFLRKQESTARWRSFARVARAANQGKRVGSGFRPKDDRSPVFPAKAGIQECLKQACLADAGNLDSGLRQNDDGIPRLSCGSRNPLRDNVLLQRWFGRLTTVNQWVPAFAGKTIGALQYSRALSASNKKGPVLRPKHGAFLSSKRKVSSENARGSLSPW